MPVSRLLEAHFRQILRLEDGAARRLLEVYLEAERELANRLMALDQQGQGDSFTAQHLALIKAQIESALAAVNQEAGADLATSFREALDLGASQSISEIADLERRFGDGELAGRLSSIPPVIPAEQVAAIADPQRLLLARFRDGVFENVSRELAQSLLQGESIGKAVGRLRRSMEGNRYQLERIARTEINHAANFGHQSAISQVADEFPEMGLQKQWSAHLDSRTSRRCKGLHLQVKNHDEPFRARDGWVGMFPPSHPNCRSRVMPYSKRWERDSVKKIAEQAPGTATNPSQASRPTQSDRRSARRSNQARGF